MPATPSQLRRPIIIDHTVDFGDDVTVTFRYDRNKITDAWMREWNELERSQEGHSMNEMLVDLLHGWDVVNEDGTPYPLTVESLAYLFNLPDKMRLIGELVTASAPSDAEGKDLSAPTSTAPLVSTEPPPTLQNGTLTSPSPAPSASPSPT
jgi:hypothetical protein